MKRKQEEDKKEEEEERARGDKRKIKLRTKGI